jgi:hypothetical protein
MALLLTTQMTHTAADGTMAKINIPGSSPGAPTKEKALFSNIFAG